jgi:hypothetical protein
MFHAMDINSIKQWLVMTAMRRQQTPNSGVLGSLHHSSEVSTGPGSLQARTRRPVLMSSYLRLLSFDDKHMAYPVK